MWLIIALASLFALFLFVLSVPIDLQLNLDVYGRARFKLKLVWLFGLVSKELGRREKKAKPKKDKEGKGGARRALDILRTRGLLIQIKILVIDVFKSISIKQLRANLDVGFDNPADTGLLFACIGPTLVFLNPPARYSINIKPSFGDGPILEGYLQAVGRLLPIRLVIPLLRFIFSLPTFRLIRKMASDRWKKKR